MKYFFIFLLSCLSFTYSFSQTITVTVDPTQDVSYISPWIYGRNNNVSDNPASPTTASQWQMYNDAGLRMYRENGGNNSTKYNWRKKLSSHPDWYNNVYDHDWDYSASSIMDNTSNTQCLYAFQLLGKVASNKTHNFDDYAYTQANGNISTSKNWAGGGGPAAFGGNDGDGDINQYLQDWPADSTTAILNHWFGTESLGLDRGRFLYWNMDNEPEIWSGTHNDVITTSISAEAFMQKYFAVAKAARLKFPNIKLVGPVSTNEWQWYNWNNSKVTDTDGNKYPWIEYFIKRVAEEEQATGIRLLDVLDFHFYPNTASKPSETLQLHRVWYDTQYNFPGANGVKVTGSGSWDASISSEYIFKRCQQWLDQYMGSDNKVTFGVSEYGAIANHGSENPNVIACWYASTLGTFANHGVTLFTPWDWYVGQWEVLHLFSKKFGTFSNQAVSSNEDTLSAYSSLSLQGDTLSIILVNRDQANSREVSLNIQNFAPSQSSVQGFQLANLPSNETFVSKTDNALQSLNYILSGNKLTLSVPKLSVTLIQIPTDHALATPPILGTRTAKPISNTLQLYPNPANNELHIVPEKSGNYTILIQNMLGKTVGTWHLRGSASVDISPLLKGAYIVQMHQGNRVITRKIVKE